MCARGPLIDTRFYRVDSLKATRASNPKGPNTLNRDKTAISVLEKLLIVFVTKTDPMWAVYLLMHTTWCVFLRLYRPPEYTYFIILVF